LFGFKALSWLRLTPEEGEKGEEIKAVEDPKGLDHQTGC
jgi:hypothetical protein